MARVHITVPDDLVEQARAAGLNVSRLAAAALAEELERCAKCAALDTAHTWAAGVPTTANVSHPGVTLVPRWPPRRAPGPAASA